MKNIKMVAFDCDGVMFDTKKTNRAFYNQILNHFGKPDLTPEQFAHVHMHAVHESLKHLFANEKERVAADAYRQQMDYFRFIPYMDIEPYLKPLLKKLQPRYKTAVVTNRTDTIDALLAEHRLEPLFDLVICARDVKRPKPHPDPLLKTLDHFHLSPSEAVYIGDSPVDEQAAQAAGITLIAYDNDTLLTPYHIKRLDELEKILKNNCSLANEG